MRGIIRVTVIYEVEADTDWYSNTQWYEINPDDSEEMRLVKGAQRDFVDSPLPLEDLCMTGGMQIEGAEFKKWL